MSMELEEQYDRIYRYCYYRLHHVQMAEDITQETFLRYFEKKGADTGRPLAYLYTIARNLCIDEYRKKSYGEIIKDLPDMEEQPVEDSIVLKQVLSELSEQEQELIFLRYVNEVPISDMAGFLGISRFALYRELKKLLKKLERRLSDG